MLMRQGGNAPARPRGFVTGTGALLTAKRTLLND